jgi:hypothetical protein
MIRKTLAASLMFGMLAVSVNAKAAETRGLSVQLRASEATDAPIIETVELYSKSYALVIGNDNYTGDWPRLGKAIEDARNVSKALKEAGFEVTLKTNLKSDQLEDAFSEFFIEKGNDPDARLLVWFAGHGHTDRQGEGYLIPVDGALERNRKQFLRTAISLRDFGKFVRYAQSKHVFTIFDSCFSGTIFNVARAAPPPQITRITTKPVRQFLTSGDAGQTVSDDGTFAKLFIEALKGERRADGNGDGYLTASEMGAFLDGKMSNYTGNRQTPRYGKLRSPEFDKGDFVFQLASVGPKRVVERSSEGQDKETVFWQSIEDSSDRAMFSEYLKQYPNGSFSGLARLKLKRLQQTKRASLSPPSFVVKGLDETLVALRTANVRELPTASSSKVTTLEVGSAVEVTGKTQFEGKVWYRVAVADRTAYVFGALLGEKAKPVVSRPPRVEARPKETPAPRDDPLHQSLWDELAKQYSSYPLLYWNQTGGRISLKGILSVTEWREKYPTDYKETIDGFLEKLDLTIQIRSGGSKVVVYTHYKHGRIELIIPPPTLNETTSQRVDRYVAVLSEIYSSIFISETDKNTDVVKNGELRAVAAYVLAQPEFAPDRIR